MTIAIALYFLAGILFMLYVSYSRACWKLAQSSMFQRFVVIMCWPFIVISLLGIPPEQEDRLVVNGRPVSGSKAQDSSRREERHLGATEEV
jgi:hypothetical protein